MYVYIYIHITEKFNSLVWGTLTLAPITLAPSPKILILFNEYT